jgi:hypothetical protein
MGAVGRMISGLDHRKQQRHNLIRITLTLPLRFEFGFYL